MGMSQKKGYTPKKRNSGKQKRRSIVIIAAEGKNKTEKTYFKDFAAFKKRNIKFAHGCDTDPQNLVNELIEEKARIDFDSKLGDKAYCVLDTDVSPAKNEQIKKADALAKKNGIRLIVSSPCFEIWFLCHFGANSTHYNNSKDVVADLRKKISFYQKNTEGMFFLLANKTQEAVTNARILEKRCKDEGRIYHTVEFSPSTDVYIIAEELNGH